MSKIITTKEQNEFLSKEGIYFQWLENITKRYPNTDLDLTNDGADFIIRYFSWVNTPEGHDFWSSYDMKFRKFLKTL